ncbi:MAG: hypothetical protein ABUL43_02315 [Hyphomicrobium sp.]
MHDRVDAVPKVTLSVDGAERGYAASLIFQTQVMSSGKQRILLSVPPEMPELFSRLVDRLQPPLYVLYVLHTPRGEGEPGRYQSTELSGDEVRSFLSRFSAYFAEDARHDIWVYSPATKRSIIWDRHNELFAEGEPFADIVAELNVLGFKEGIVDRIASHDHIHHYRPELDADAAAVVGAYDWYRTPLRPEDAQ